MAVPAPRYTTYIALDSLAPSPGNPKKHEIERIIESIQSHGFLDQPIVDERTGLAIGGHGRRESLHEMQQRGMRTPDGILVDDDGSWLVPVQRGWSSRSDTEAKTVIIKLNRLTQDGGWDARALAAFFEDIITSEPDLYDSLAIPDDELEDLLRRVDPETLPGAIRDSDTQPPTLQLADDDLGAGAGLSPDDEGRPRVTTCPACGHHFTPGRKDS
ncbi:ParB N-terminal domain-containing protein [Streptomyces sp. NPDC048717]|uniref:ParB N-terminal domain-containing protein n=1 Tax=Streptomyces sp. NPDC048717 TaxID=3154928 RepID=UPI00343FC8D9